MISQSTKGVRFVFRVTITLKFGISAEPSTKFQSNINILSPNLTGSKLWDDKTHWGHWWRWLLPMSSIITDAKLVDSNHYGIWCWSLLAIEWIPIFTSQSIVSSYGGRGDQTAAKYWLARSGPSGHFQRHAIRFCNARMTSAQSWSRHHHWFNTTPDS